MEMPSPIGLGVFGFPPMDKPSPAGFGVFGVPAVPPQGRVGFGGVSGRAVSLLGPGQVSWAGFHCSDGGRTRPKSPISSERDLPHSLWSLLSLCLDLGGAGGSPRVVLSLGEDFGEEKMKGLP